VNRFLSVNQIQVTSSRDCFELSTLAWRITSMCRSSEGISSSSQDRGEKRTHITAVSSSGIWLGQPRRKIITVSSAALRPPSVWRRPIGRPRTTWLRTIDENIQPQNLGHGGRLGTGRSGIKSSVRQRSVRSSPPRRRRVVFIVLNDKLVGGLLGLAPVYT